ncbi:MAG: ABC transporter substrate-binding protein [Janthinobacterium lividum]
MRKTVGVVMVAASLLAGRAAWSQAQSGPLRLGLLLDLSGVYADMTGTGSKAAAEMAAADFGGSVLNRRIEILAADTQTRADLASSKAREWFSDGGVEAVMDVVGSSAALAVQEVGRLQNKVVVMNAPASLPLINASCSPTSVVYTYTTYGLAHSVGQALVASGGKSWFFIAADYAFGAGLVTDTSDIVQKAGGKVLGVVKNPLNTQEYSSSLITAQASGADVVALANAGSDMINAVKQAHEFGLDQGKQRLVGLVGLITDIHSLGLQSAQGLLLSESFYWNLNDDTRAFSRRFFAKTGRMPTMIQAGTYSSVTHYLKAVQSAGTVEAGAVMAKMKDTPIHDFFAPNGRIRADGLMVHDMYLFQVKTPAESKEPWDYYKPVATVPADQVSPPLSESTCVLVKK